MKNNIYNFFYLLLYSTYPLTYRILLFAKITYPCIRISYPCLDSVEGRKKHIIKIHTPSVPF
ncbi:hypothetical protein RHMOL_Rhmol02G0129400 [Rhododendron molle]|uniref:Uncharacterized protein n=1 Tax=Rhododendron molle TaxID=49168 RepID=A0ACC0PS76_RHOML|nr:hypothetical protein RHMOL_Rhmol02G0129400 [Rhododendron molle]